MVSDADLFCDAYTNIRDLGSKDVVFLGASRMQTGLDLATFSNLHPDRKALMLAQSGKGSSYPVFRDIVEKTNYHGIAIVDETETTLTSENGDQLPSVKHCYQNFSINRQLNTRISIWLQSHLIFLNPQSSSFRLWGNLAGAGKLPVPFYTKTLGDRQQLTDYARAQPKALQALHDSRLKDPTQQLATQTSPTFATWFAKTQHWRSMIAKFQQRGGKVIFVRMPVARELWQIERKIYPPARYWQPWMKQLNLPSIHFADYPELSAFQLPDTSHLDLRDKATFTKRFLARVHSSF